MPIKNLRSGIPVIGYAKIGSVGESRNGRQPPPVKWDHIELTGIRRDSAGRLLPDTDAMQKLTQHAEVPTCGGCKRSEQLGFPDGLPTRIPIVLVYNDPEVTFPHRLAMYRGRRAFCVGDGEEAMRLEEKGTTKDRQGREVPVFGEAKPFGPCGDACPDFQAGRCKPNGRLRFMLSIQESIGGCYEFKTTSWNSIANIAESLNMIRQLSGGVVEWIPLWFEIAPQTVQPKDGSPPNEAQIARIRFLGNPQKLLETVRETLQLKAPVIQEVRRLEARIERGVGWNDEPPEEEAATAAEFYEAGQPEPQAAREGGEAEAAGAPAAPTPEPSEPAPGPAPAPAPEPEEESEPPAAAEPKQQSWADAAF